MAFTVTTADRAGNTATHTVTYAVTEPDRDGDGVLDASDNFVDVANSTQEDGDRDGLGDACDSERAAAYQIGV